MRPTYKGPYQAPSYIQTMPTVKSGIQSLPSNKIPTVSDGVIDIAPPPLPEIDMEQEAAFIDDPRNRSILDSDATDYGESTNVFTLSKSESRLLDTEVAEFKATFLRTYLHQGATLNVALDQAAAETEAYMQAKFGIDVDVDTGSVAEYANSVLDASALSDIMKTTSIPDSVQHEVILDYILKEFEITRAQLKSRRLAQIQAETRRRYASSLENPVGSEEGRFAVFGQRK